ncbi:hypothetical protein TrCOL_g11824 [Triparma columacea]|uniref:Uncharacterized protein n=1 Tax=Triparma columacea TaxID=722753 RepID=A0A9W7L9W2_9STRA|nr:hypothetical protein TrCOL_g11824 [Triparma columacea]
MSEAPPVATEIASASEQQSSVPVLSGPATTDKPPQTEASPPPPPQPVLKDELAHLPVDAKLTELIITSYEGEKDEDGRFEGKGKAVFVDGNVYEGGFHLGMMHGKGCYTFRDGVYYDGSFFYNKITGAGTYKWPDSSSYTGEVKDGLRHGKGTFVSPDQVTTYDGDWVSGKREGLGTIYYDEDKAVYYKGQWVANQRSGKGLVVYPSGNTYDGEWKANRKNGKGEMFWADKNEKYSGDWKDDRQDGFGEHVWLAGNEAHFDKGDTTKQRCNLYSGQWVDGQRHGIGTFFYANGSQYHGSWENNIKQGFGVFTYPDGHVYEGGFENDRMPSRSDAVRASEDVAPQLKLNISDITDTSTENAMHEVKLLENVLLRYNTEFKVVYKHYAQIEVGKIVGEGTQVASGANGISAMTLNPSASTANLPTVFTMNMEQLRHLCKDCKLLSTRLTFAEVHEIFFRMRRHHALSISAAWEGDGKKKDGGVFYDGEDEGGYSLYDPFRPVLFREFVEGIVRIAYTKYCILNPEVTIKTAIEGVVEDHLRVYATQTGLDIAEDKMAEPKVQNAISANMPLFETIWAKYAVAGRGSGVMLLREFVLFATDCSSFGKRRSKNVKEILSLTRPAEASHHNHHHYHHHHEDENGPNTDVLDSCLVKAEFLEALVRLSADSNKEQVPLQEKVKLYVTGTLAPLMDNFEDAKPGQNKIKVTGLGGQKLVTAHMTKARNKPPRKVVL